jgi:hypothetical protein
MQRIRGFSQVWRIEIDFHRRNNVLTRLRLDLRAFSPIFLYALGVSNGHEMKRQQLLAGTYRQRARSAVIYGRERGTRCVSFWITGQAGGRPSAMDLSVAIRN